MDKISSKEIFAFTFFLSCFLFPGFGDTIVLENGKNMTIIACIIGMIVGFIPLLLIIYLHNKTINKNIFELNRERFKFFGHILNFLLIISIIYVIAVGTWTIITFTISQFLTRTSYYLILITMMFLVSLATIKKIEVIGRTSLILLGFFICITLFSYIFLIPSVDIDNFFPIFNVNYKNFIQTILYYPTFSVIPILSILAIKKANIIDNKKSNSRIILGYIFGSLIVIIFLLLIIGTFGIDISVLFTYPEYTLFKKINVFNFIQRIENIISTIIFIASFISFTILSTFIVNYVKNLVKFKSKRKLNITISVLCFIFPFITLYLFQNYPILYIFTNYPKISIFIFIILVINVLLIFITNNKKKLTKS